MKPGSILAIIAAFFACSTSRAQAPTPDLNSGTMPFQAYDGGEFDKVNLQNGNLTIKIPLVSYPQRGGKLKLDFSLVYNGKPFTHQKTCAGLPGYGQTCTWGWIPGARTESDLASPQKSGWYVVDDQQIIPGGFRYIQNVDLTLMVDQVETSDTSQHIGLGVSSTQNGEITSDGTGFFSGMPMPNVQGDWSCPSQCYWIGPDGIIYYPTLYTSGWPSTGATTLRVDPDGNEITGTPSPGLGIPNVTSYTDTMGRVIPSAPSPSRSTNQSACTSSNLPSLQYAVSAASIWETPGINGGNMTYTLCYAEVPVNMPPLDNTNARDYGGAGNYLALERVVLPNGQAWTFTYGSVDQGNPGCTFNGSACNYGDLESIIFPTGGTISYTYELLRYGYPNDMAAEVNSASMSVYSRTQNAQDGQGNHTWQYTWPTTDGYPGTDATDYSNWQTTVTDPLNDQTVHSFSTLGCNGIQAATDLYQTLIQQYSGSATGTPLKSVATQYQSLCNIGGYNPGAQNVFPISTTVTLNNGASGLVSQQTMQYCCSFTPLDESGSGTTTYGLLSDAKIYDFGSGAPGSLLQEQQITYQIQNHSAYFVNNFLALPATDTLLNGSGTSMSSTTYTYDQTQYLTHYSPAVTGTTTPIQPERGHLTTITQSLFGGTSPQSHLNWYDTGEVYQSIDPKSNVTTLSYSATYEGALPTQVTDPLNQGTSFSYDFNLGKPLTVTDPNSQITTYTYNDPFGRLTDVLFPNVYLNTATHGETKYVYNDTASPVSIVATSVLSPSVSKQEEVDVDGFGREAVTKVLTDPQGITYSRQSYDALGRKYQVWNPSRCNPVTSSSCPGETTWGYRTHLYDALSRPVSTQNPDGTSTYLCYNNTPTSGQPNCNKSIPSVTEQWVDLMDENGNDRQQTEDALGRITYLAEPNGSSQAPSMITAYSYDALGNLLNVTQNGTSGSTARIRSFTYDSLSRLLCASNPESSYASCPTTYSSYVPGTTGYSYDTNGNEITRTDARGVITTYSYDALNRVVSMSYSDGATPLSCYLYGTPGSGVSGANQVGRLMSEWTQSGSTCGTPQSGFITMRSITAYDAMGRILNEQQSTPATQVNGTAYSPQYQYDLASNLIASTDGTTPIPSSTSPSGCSTEPTVWSTLSFVNCYDTSGRLLNVTSNWADTSHPSSLVGGATYWPQGNLWTANFGNGVGLNRSYNNRLKITGETDQGTVTNSTPGLASVPITGAEQTQ